MNDKSYFTVRSLFLLHSPTALCVCPSLLSLVLYVYISDPTSFQCLYQVQGKVKGLWEVLSGSHCNKKVPVNCV